MTVRGHKAFTAMPSLRIAARGSRAFQMGQARLRAEKRAADVDAEHEVEALHRRFQRPGQADCARIVEKDVDAAELPDGCLDRRVYGRLVADVADDRQCLG